MAIWQFDCMVIPHDNIEMDVDSEDILLWKGENILVDLEEKIEQILLRNKSWSKDIYQYGSLDKTCIELLCENACTFEFSMRLDLRSLSKENFKRIVGMIGEINGYILYQKEIYSPDFGIIIEVLKKSPAAQFCRDPIGYFESLEKRK